MDEQQMLSSSSSTIVSTKKYDVFLSFRGEDTRLTFTSHLYKALNEKKIKTFMDDQLEKGDEISTTLIEAIKDSYISIIIFSMNYASSKWCLDELSTIMKCKKDQKQIVLPVFYGIDPSHVRRQTGSFEQAFAIHKEDPRYHQWINDLTTAANIVGYDSKNRIEPELVGEIVKVILEKLVHRYPNQRPGLVGFDESYEDIKSLLNIRSNEVKILGIWGMGGIGKTTLATSLYEKLSHEFEGHCFLTNVREKSDKLEKLCKELFSKLSGKEKHSFDAYELRGLLQSKKVFIVLDDVSTDKELEEVIYQFYPLGPGSRVIVTTRDKQIFRSEAVIYPVQGLSDPHSLELFCLSAFEQKQPKDGYENISKKVIFYCGGIPLALKVVGARLHSKSKEFWKCQLNKLQSIPDTKIQKVLKLSYDDLDRFQQRIFLDIACFHKGQPRNYVTKILKAFDFFSISGIEVLLDKALITIPINRIEMHDLLQEMGQEIVHQESTEYPEKRSRLWKHEEVVEVLKKNKDNDVVEGIILDLDSLDKDLNLISDFLVKMTRLRFLKIFRMSMNLIYWYPKENFNIYLLDGLQSFSDKLRYFHWDEYCLESLPYKFCAEELVVLIMRNSKLKKLWDGIQNLMNLKEIDLLGSRDLIEMPDFSKAKKLERVNLRMCRSLLTLHPSILSHSNLRYLDLGECTKIGSLNIHSKYLGKLLVDRCSSLTDISITSDHLTRLNINEEFELFGVDACLSLKKISITSDHLTELYLNGVSKLESLNVNARSLVHLRLARDHSFLKEFSLVSEKITELHLDGTAISSFSSISSLPKLRFLDLSDCKEIEGLDLESSKSLRELILSGCSSLKEISRVPEEITTLQLSDTAITSLSSISSLQELICINCKEIERLDLQSKSLRKLILTGCSSLKEISVVSEEITKLKLSGTAITSLSSVSSLHKLEYFDLIDCKEIERLDLLSKSLRLLKLYGCSSLKEISITSDHLEELNLIGVSKLESLNVNARSLVDLHLHRRTSLKKISVVSEEITRLNFSDSAITSFSSISSLPKLTHLDLSYCKEIERLKLHSKSLRILKLKGCSSLKEISVTSDELTDVELSDTAITSLWSSISSLPKLTYLALRDCRNLESLPELPSDLYVLRAYNCIWLETEMCQRKVLKHMLQSTIPYVHQHPKHPSNLSNYFALPGDHVINECVFQTAESSISISGLTMSDLSGFIYCIILSKGSCSLSHSHEMSVSIYQDDLQHLLQTQDSRQDDYPRGLITDHVTFWYHHISESNRITELYDHPWDVEIKFHGKQKCVKGFGVFPVYTTTSGFKLLIFKPQSMEPKLYCYGEY